MAQPSYVLPSTTHADATLSGPVAPAWAPNAPPLSPRDDDVDDLTFVAQDGFESTAAARDSPDVVCTEIVMPSRFSRQPECVVRARRLERTALKFVDCLPRPSARASPQEKTPSSRRSSLRT
eukprot:2110800-Prymnesium_polylepis.1